MFRKIVSLAFILVLLFLIVVSPVMAEESSVHDVAVISVVRSVPLEKLYPGNATILYVHAGTWSLYVNVTVKNVGDFTENLTVKAYYDGTVIGTQSVTNLAPGASIRLDFKWTPKPVLVHFNRATKKYLGYTVSANATLSGDANPGNNALINGEVRPIFLADVNIDGIVSGGDGGLIGFNWYKKPGDPGCNPLADINFDGIVSGADGALIGANWYKPAPP